MKLIVAEQAWEDYLYWQRQDKRTFKRVNELIEATTRGIGKPEFLKHALAGFGSRRINEEHRVVYKVEKDALLLAQPRYHY